ncbi:neutrophil gelatinase-associated lipocalin [Paralichthys olivaceus]|uniref:neutrophil gelatinase-associated lipocalin n=1 Tax=Paralichthys olivaceus TaxID=8255 RepID=UPI00097D8DFA|nr:PREDICTED: neutrophil gelatinase-associated lipocalin [Paralichthys olivaceus]
MRTTVLAVVMVMCVMMVAADVKPQRDFNLQRFAGKWYRVGLAYDSPSFAPYRDMVKASMGIIKALPNGNANLTMWEARPGDCRSHSYHYEATGVPGQFTYFSQRHGIVKDVTVVDTNYNEYAVVLKHKVFNREYTQVSLYGRSLKMKTDIIQRFKGFALSQGLSRESILIPPPAENCPPSGSGR